MTKQSTRVVLAKATPSESSDSGPASFVGYASVFDNVDSYGDVVRKGAFAKAVSALSAEGATPLGVYYAHQMGTNPYGLVGVVKSLEEDDHGLKVTAELLVDSNPEAKFLHEAMQLGVINEMSFAYYVEEGGFAKVDGEEIFEIKSVDLLEVSVCPVGANRQALVQEVKSRVDSQQRVKADEPVTVEDEADEKADGGAGDVAAAARELASTIGDAVSTLTETRDALLAALGDEPDGTEDEAGKSADEDSEAAAEEAQKVLALRVRAAMALAHTSAGKEAR